MKRGVMMEHQSHPEEPVFNAGEGSAKVMQADAPVQTNAHEGGISSSNDQAGSVQQSEQQAADTCHAVNLDQNGKPVRQSHHSQEMKSNLISRLNRVEGQIRGIKGLIEKDTYCDDVLTQIAAAQSALNSVGKLLLEGHMKSCIVERIQAGEHEVVDELLVTVRKLMK